MRGQVIDFSKRCAIWGMAASALAMDLSFIADIPPPRTPVAAGASAAAVLAFALTVLIEWPLLAWWSGLGFRRTALFALLANGLTWGAAMGMLVIWRVPIPLLE